MNVKMTTVLAVVYLLVNPALGYAVGDLDGNWWSSLSANQKVTYVAGFFDGMNYEFKMEDYVNLLVQDDPKTQSWSPERAKVLVDLGKAVESVRNRDFGKLTVAQVVAGLDKVYSDYRNLRISPLDAIPVVIRSIVGSSDDEINKLLEQKRKNAAK